MLNNTFTVELHPDEGVGPGFCRIKAQVVVYALYQTGGHITQAARLLEISYITLRRCIKGLGLDPHVTRAKGGAAPPALHPDWEHIDIELPPEVGVGDRFSEVKKQVLCYALTEEWGHVRAAAERLGLHNTRLHYLITKLGMRRLVHQIRADLRPLAPPYKRPQATAHPFVAALLCLGMLWSTGTPSSAQRANPRVGSGAVQLPGIAGEVHRLHVSLSFPAVQRLLYTQSQTYNQQLDSVHTMYLARVDSLRRDLTACLTSLDQATGVDPMLLAQARAERDSLAQELATSEAFFNDQIDSLKAGWSTQAATIKAQAQQLDTLAARVNHYATVASDTHAVRLLLGIDRLLLDWMAHGQQDSLAGPLATSLTELISIWKGHRNE